MIRYGEVSACDNCCFDIILFLTRGLEGEDVCIGIYSDKYTIHKYGQLDRNRSTNGRIQLAAIFSFDGSGYKIIANEL